MAMYLYEFNDETILYYITVTFEMCVSTMKFLIGSQTWSLIQFHTLVILSLIFCQTSRTLSHKDWNHGNRVLAMKPQIASQMGLMMTFHAQEMAPWILGVERHHQRSEEHTSELQSRENIVCRLLLDKKKNAGKARIRSVQKSCE